MSKITILFCLAVACAPQAIETKCTSNSDCASGCCKGRTCAAASSCDAPTPAPAPAPKGC